MKIRLASKTLVITCLLTTGMYSHQATAAWPASQSEAYYVPQLYNNEKYGDFPPVDIDQTLMSNAAKTPAADAEQSPAAASNITPDTTQTQLYAAPNNPIQTYQPQNYGNYNQQNYNANRYGQNYRPGNMQRGNQGFNFNSPWNNRGNSFSSPMNNNGSSFSFPWGNNGSGFSPWGSNNSWRR